MHLFVYGSLRKGFHNHHLLEDAAYIGDYKTEGIFYMVGKYTRDIEDDYEDIYTTASSLRTLIFPYISHNNMGDMLPIQISGEVYDVSYELLMKLDIHEGHPTAYIRYPYRVYNAKHAISVFIYILENQEIIEKIRRYGRLMYEPIKSGDWKVIKTRVGYNHGA